MNKANLPSECFVLTMGALFQKRNGDRHGSVFSALTAFAGLILSTACLQPLR